MFFTHSEDFISLLGRTLNSKTCRLINYVTGNSRYKDRWTASFESRATLVAEVAAVIEVHAAKRLLDEILRVLEERLEKGNSKPEALTGLLRRLKELKLIDFDTHISLLEKAKGYLLNHLEWWDEFKAFCDFEKAFTDLVTDEDRQFVIKKFRTVAYSDWDYSSDAPDNYRDDANQIQSISKKLGIDMTSESRN